MPRTSPKINLKKRYHIFFNNDEFDILENISKESNKSRSAVIRQLLRGYKYIQVVTEIEKHNAINLEFLRQIKRIGANINQIAFHLNIDITKKSQAENDLEKELKDINKQFKTYEKLLKTKTIKIEPENHQRKRIVNE